MYHVGAALCQTVIQVLLPVRSHRLANTPIQYRYILNDSTISVLHFSIIRCTRGIEIHVCFLELLSKFQPDEGLRTRRFTDDVPHVR